ncbi:hypothetical protein PFISCL1PPCAC_1923, partial [Pristionchus fissidentatus]
SIAQMAWDTVVIMGVAGCGKSTVAEELSKRLQWTMLEGDRLHPIENIEKMKKGIPLNDSDRFPWLRSIRHEIGLHGSIIVSCSALKKSYREILCEDRRCLFVFLDVSKEELMNRLTTRSSHFFPSVLLDSQLSTLERPSNDETSLTITVSPSTSVTSVVDQIVENINTQFIHQKHR